ncbi:hypothetical protein [Rhodococcus koreensis]|uniref:hypothetical protein n=1 Tax=Rhodococcus koreensis TaxID=99653 RepID=UPI00366DAC1E
MTQSIEPHLRPYDVTERCRSGSGLVLLTGVEAIARGRVEPTDRLGGREPPMVTPSAAAAAAAGGVETRLDMLSIECEDTSAMVPRVTTMFFRLGVELRDLSTWRSVRTEARQGVAVTIRIPGHLSPELLVKRLNRLIGVIKIRHADPILDVPHCSTFVEAGATGQFVEGVALLGIEFRAAVLDYTRNFIVLRFSGPPHHLGSVLERLTKLGAKRMPGDIRVSTRQVTSAVLLRRIPTPT